ncbi:MAG: endonuclease YncB(thermonuclease family) [Planctomycetota bacterium]|jgi:endonuclease YncB( thermonuclease family)
MIASLIFGLLAQFSVAPAAAALPQLAPQLALLAATRQDSGGTQETGTSIADRGFNTETGKWPAPTELYPVTRVIDGDTIWIQRNGKRDKLRLLSVDTEEQMIGSRNATVFKPETLFGEECARWSEEFFAGLALDGETPMVGLVFPDGVERNDIYGRLLCQVVLPDGTDYNLLLVQKGKSPYFNKYGNSRLTHAAFVAAQDAARAAQLGIWDPKTNSSDDPAKPAVKRPYERLLPWWQARADALDLFRARAAEAPDKWIEAEDSASVRRAAAAGDPVNIFAGVNRLFDEDDGSLTVLFRAGDKDAAVRAIIPAAAKNEFLAGFDVRLVNENFHQNFIYLSGTLTRGPRGFRLNAGDPANWRFAAPRYDDVQPGDRQQ